MEVRYIEIPLYASILYFRLSPSYVFTIILNLLFTRNIHLLFMQNRFKSTGLFLQQLCTCIFIIYHTI